MSAAEQYAKDNGITVTVVRDNGIQKDDRGWEHHSYALEVSSSVTGASMETPWMQGTAIEGSPQNRAGDVIESLISDAADAADKGFEEWAGDFGYDTDSRQAESVYTACRDLIPKVAALLGGLSELERARDIVCQ